MPNSLTQGQSLAAGQQLTSDNGKVFLLMQSDGNLVLHRSSDHKVLWSSETHDRPATHVSMQGDGNLVVSGNDRRAYWATGTSSYPGSRCVLRNNGDLVIYSAQDRVVWNSHTIVDQDPVDLTKLRWQPSDGLSAPESFKQAVRSLFENYRDRYLGFEYRISESPPQGVELLVERVESATDDMPSLRMYVKTAPKYVDDTSEFFEGFSEFFEGGRDRDGEEYELVVVSSEGFSREASRTFEKHDVRVLTHEDLLRHMLSDDRTR